MAVKRIDGGHEYKSIDACKKLQWENVLCWILSLAEEDEDCHLW